MLQRLFLAIALTSVLGAGCWKQAPKPLLQKTSLSGSESVRLASDSASEEESAIKKTPSEELAEALIRFKELKSFRAKISLTMSKTPISGVIEISKPERMRANLSIAGVATIDIIIAGSNSYVRQDNQPWQDISASKEGKKLSTMLLTMANGRTSITQYSVKKDDTVTKTRDNEYNCDLYTANLKSADGKPNDIQACVINGVMKYVKLQNPEQGPVLFEYYDHNALFLIERPI